MGQLNEAHPEQQSNELLHFTCTGIMPFCLSRCFHNSIYFKDLMRSVSLTISWITSPTMKSSNMSNTDGFSKVIWTPNFRKIELFCLQRRWFHFIPEFALRSLCSSIKASTSSSYDAISDSSWLFGIATKSSSSLLLFSSTSRAINCLRRQPPRAILSVKWNVR